MELAGRAYLDIETSFNNALTVVGVFRPDRGFFVQLVGDLATQENLLNALDGATNIVTYNGNRFDLPMLNRCLSINLFALFDSHDLMYECLRKGLKGGLKAVEKRLGISRSIFGKGDDDPRFLWDRFRSFGDQAALERLLEYNRQDTLNLFLLEERLFNLPPRGSIEDYVERYARLM